MTGGCLPESSETDPLQAGRCSSRAVSSADKPYPPSTVFFFTYTATPEISTPALHDALPIWNVVDAANPAALGSQVHDTATVTSGIDGFAPSGTVTYHLYSG